MINPNLKVIKAWFVETGTAPDMAAHSLITQVTPSALTAFEYNTQQGRMLHADAMVGVAGNMLVPDVGNSRTVNIPNTFRTQRYRFVMRVANPNHPAGTTYIYTGYTDTPAWSSAVKDFAPETRMYVNNILKVMTTPRMTPTGMVPHVTVSEISHLMHPDVMNGGGQIASAWDPYSGYPTFDQATLLRPVDVSMHLAKDMMQKSLGGIIGDARSGVGLVKSNRLNSVPSQYLHKTTSALWQGMSEFKDNIGTASPEYPYEYATTHTNERDVMADGFLSPFLMDYGLNTNGFISWGDLTRHHPEIHSPGVTEVVRRSQTKLDPYMSDASNFDSTIGDKRPVTMFNEQVMATLPGLLLQNLISYAKVHVTNMTPDGSLVVMVSEPLTVIEVGPEWLMSRIPMLENIISRQVFSDLSYTQYAPFDAHFMVDVFGESFTNVSYNGEPPIAYPHPTYCDHMLTQLVSPTNQTLAHIANDLNHLVTHIAN